MFAEVILLVESAALKKTLQNYHNNLHYGNNSYYKLGSPSGRTPGLPAAAIPATNLPRPQRTYIFHSQNKKSRKRISQGNANALRQAV